MQKWRAVPFARASLGGSRGIPAELAHEEAAQAAADGAAVPGLRRLAEAEGHAQVRGQIDAFAEGRACGR